jgi:release factor glutamine methyltransferase
VARLREAGLSADVLSRATIPFGPVMRRRVELLRARGLLADGATGEDIVVIEAMRAGAVERCLPEPEAA